MSPEAGAWITEIVTTVANTNVLSLWGKKGHLNALGDKVHAQVAFLNFWAYIFSDPKLANDMRRIKRSSLKYNSFISGGRDSLILRYQQEKECFLNEGDGFAKFLKVDPKKTVQLLNSGLEALKDNSTALKPFFNYLIEQKAPNYTNS